MNQYIITEEQIVSIEEHGWIDAFHILDQVRSHPYQSEPCKERGCDDIENCDEICDIRIMKDKLIEAYREGYHDGEVVGAKGERDKVLDEVIHEISTAAPEMEGKKLFITVLALCRRIEGLRQAGEP
jgi:hypothetical protein